MSKFEATLCLPPTPPTRLLDALDTALAPYDIDAGPDGYNGRGQWDWWRVGGFGGPRLPVRPEFDGDPRLIHNPLWPNGDPRPYQGLRCDGGPKEAVDVAALRHEAKVTACGERQVWIDLVANHPPARPLSHFMALHQCDPAGYPVARAKREHLTQPLIQTITRHAVDGSDPYVSTDLLFTDPFVYFGASETAFVDRATERAACTFALVTLDGQWLDWESETPLIGGVQDVNATQRFMNQYIDGLSHETLLVIVGCHV